MKYTLKEGKADMITGLLNGLTFGVVYSFFTLPFEFDKPETKLRYKGSPMRYYGSWMGRMSLAFAILRTSYNAISKEELGPAYELGGMAAVTLAVSQILF